MKNKSIAFALALSIFVITPGAQAAPPVNTGLAACTTPTASNPQIQALSGVINKLNNPSNCNGILSDPQELAIAKGADAITANFLANKISDQQRVTQTAALCKSYTDPQSLKACYAEAADVTQQRATNATLAFGMQLSWGHPLTAQEKTYIAKHYGLPSNQVDAFITQKTAPMVPYLKKLASTGAQFSSKGWDLSKMQLNFNNLQKDQRLQDAIRAFMGPDVLKTLMDPHRIEAVRVGDTMILPPQSLPAGADHKVTPGEIRTVSAADWAQKSNSLIQAWDQSLKTYESAAKAASTTGNVWKQGGHYDSWKDYLLSISWTHTHGFKIGPETAEARQMDQSGHEIRALAQQLQSQGIPKPILMKILQKNEDAFEKGSADFDNTIKNYQDMAKALFVAPIAAPVIMLGATAAAAVGGAAAGTAALTGAGWMAAFPFLFGAAKSGIIAGIDSWRVDGSPKNFFCRFATDYSSNLGADMLNANWAMAGGFGMAAGMAGKALGVSANLAKTAGAVSSFGTSAYFMGTMGKGVYQEANAAIDSYEQYRSLKQSGDTNGANAALTQSLKDFASAGMDVAMLRTMSSPTLDQVHDQLSQTAIVQAGRNYDAAQVRADTQTYRTGDVFIDQSTGNTYQVTNVRSVKTTGENAYVVKQVSGATDPAGDSQLVVFQSDLTSGNSNAVGSVIGKTTNLVKASIITDPTGATGTAMIEPIAKIAAESPTDQALAVADVSHPLPDPQDISLPASSTRTATVSHAASQDATALQASELQVERAIDAAGNESHNGGAFTRASDQSDLQQTPAQLTNSGRQYFQQGDDVYFRQPESSNAGTVEKVTDPQLAAQIKQNIAASQELAPYVEAQNAVAEATAAASSTAYRLPSDATPILKDGNLTFSEDTSGRVFEQTGGKTSSAEIVENPKASTDIANAADEIRSNANENVAKNPQQTPEQTPEQTEVAIGDLASENNLNPDKKALVAELNKVDDNLNSARDPSWRTKANQWMKQVGNDLLARGKNSKAYQKALAARRNLAASSPTLRNLQAMAGDRLMVEQVVHELSPVEAKAIENRLERDPQQAEKKVEEAFTSCGGGAVAENKKQPSLDPMGIFFTENTPDQENSCKDVLLGNS